ncbi:MAG: hypothetical protein V1743_01475 [Nanoarchaeota archaeon]
MKKTLLALAAALFISLFATIISGYNYNQFSYGNRYDYRYDNQYHAQQYYNQYADYYYTGKYYNPSVRYTGTSAYHVYTGGTNYYAPRYTGGYFVSTPSPSYPTGYQGGNFNAGSSYNRGFYSWSMAPVYGGCNSDWYYDGPYRVQSRYCSA